MTLALSAAVFLLWTTHISGCFHLSPGSRLLTLACRPLLVFCIISAAHHGRQEFSAPHNLQGLATCQLGFLCELNEHKTCPVIYVIYGVLNARVGLILAELALGAPSVCIV